MNWKQWLGYNAYKKLWSLIGGRPWTYIYRDIYRTYEIFIQAQWFWTAILILWLLGFTIPLKMLAAFWMIYTFGYINGHFFWGTRYIKGQKGGNNDA